MLSTRLKLAACIAATPRHWLAFSCSLLISASWMPAAPAFAGNGKPPLPAAAPAPAAKADPEILLLEVYKELGANRLRKAQAKADALVAAYPNFQLGQLIRGDLLQLHTRQISTFGAVVNGPADKLQNLRAEAMARLKWLQEKPDPALVPRPVLQLREDQRQVLVVDAQRSRLYVYEHQRGQLKFVTDYYISQGKSGINKLKEGDQRTPIGVYYITHLIPGPKLPDFYGPGALPLNYPNEWDKINGRTGSGIWLHGTPRDNYSRPPLSSDGCVVLTNPDLRELYQTVDAGKTPVVIAEKVEFVTKAKSDSDRNHASRLVTEWRRDMESMDPAKVLQNYSRLFKSERGENLQTFFSTYQHMLSKAKSISIQIKDASFFLYPGKEGMIVSTFTQETVSGKNRHTVRLRQYWAKEGGRWKILSEGTF